MNFVSGGSGLIGVQLIIGLLKRDEHVVAQFRNQDHKLFAEKIIKNALPNNNLSKLRWVKGDINDHFFLEDNIEEGAKVFHTAGFVSFDDRKKEMLYKANIEGTAAIANEALLKNSQCFVHVSSTAALDYARDSSVKNEEFVWNDKNKSAYAMSKYYGELEVHRAGAEGLNYVVVNPAIVLGPGEWNKGSSKLFKNAYQEFPFYTEGVNAFVSSIDVAEIMIQLSKTNIRSERFVLFSEHLDFKSIQNLMANAFQKKVPKYKVNAFMAIIAPIFARIFSFFSGKDAIITRNSSQSSVSKTYFNNEKVINALGYKFTCIENVINESAEVFKNLYELEL